MAAEFVRSYLTEEKPIVFFDSSIDPPPSFAYAMATRFYRHLAVAWTGIPNFDVSPGQLRLFWITTDGNEGKRDYELREAQTVRDGFNTLCLLPEVARVMVYGYASQNPYTMIGTVNEEKLNSKVLPPAQGWGARPEKNSVGTKIESIIDAEEEKGRRVRESNPKEGV